MALYLLYLIIPPLINWMVIDATWSGTKEEITKDGARWIFIKEKLHHFMYGFYPQDFYYRPNLAFILKYSK
jgi:general L-amino acid transport system permease protein